MPDFTRPEYQSYIALCRKLSLEHEWQEGDHLWTPGGMVGVREDVYVYHGPGTDLAHRDGLIRVWLPQLADWLDMLEEAGHDQVEFRPWGTGRYQVMLYAAGREEHGPPTREEAIGRLAVAVGAVKVPADA